MNREYIPLFARTVLRFIQVICNRFIKPNAMLNHESYIMVVYMIVRNEYVQQLMALGNAAGIASSAYSNLEAFNCNTIYDSFAA